MSSKLLIFGSWISFLLLFFIYECVFCVHISLKAVQSINE